MTSPQVLEQIKSHLRAAFGERLQRIVLYGSEARGTAGPDSDIDVLVLLDGMDDFGSDLQIAIDAIYPVALRIGRRISAKPVDASEYESVECPLYVNAHREGLFL